MKHAFTTVLAATLLLTTACAHQPSAAAGNDGMADRAGGATARQADVPAVASNDDLMKLTCADFLATAKIATTVPADDAALAAQDELVNGMIWVHGYMFASNGGRFDALSQDWIKATAKRVFDRCAAAKDPRQTNLFEVATS